MDSWSKMPFVRIIIPFVAGILMYRSGIHFLAISQLTSILIALFLALGAWLLFLKKFNSYNLRHVQSVLLIFTIFISAYYISHRNDFRNNENFIGNTLPNSEVEMMLQIDNSVEQKNGTFKTTARAVALKTEEGWQKSEGEILLYIAQTDSAQTPDYGDLIATKFILSVVEKPVFNSDFNYQKFLADKNIFHQAYISDGNWTLLEQNKGNPLMAFALAARNKLVSILQNQLGKTEEYAVVSAMLTGYRADLSADMMQAYSKAGVIHIMSVSGLHVGVIYIMISSLLGLFAWLKRKKWLRVIVVLLLIWFYSMITGLSASVLRSAVMISFIVLGEALHRKINPLNSLCAAAFILLAINPGSIGEVGFQLSFAAVAGIFLFQKPIYRLAYVRNKWIDQIWQLACVSLAAQIATLPFILYYFGQFPVYFLLTNILVVPLSGIVLYAAMGAVLLSWIPGLNVLAAWATILLVKIMNFIVVTVESLPYAVAGNIFVNAWSALVIAMIIALIFAMITMKKIRLIFPILIFATLASAFQWNHAIENKNSSFWFALKDGKQYLTGIKHKQNLYIVEPEPDYLPSAFVLNRVINFAKRNGLKTIAVPPQFNDSVVFRNNQFIAFANYKAITINDYKIPPATISLPQADIVIAPKMSKYYQEKFVKLKPEQALMIKYGISKSSIIDLNQHRDWVFYF